MDESTLAEQIWLGINSPLTGVRKAFEASWSVSREHYTDSGLQAYASTAANIARWGRGADPVIAWLTHAPYFMTPDGELPPGLWQTALTLQRSSNSCHLSALFASLRAIAQTNPDPDRLSAVTQLTHALMTQTTVSIHGRQTLEPSAAVGAFLASAPSLLAELSMDDLRQWVRFGVGTSDQRPDYLEAYFACQSPESVRFLKRLKPGMHLEQIIPSLVMLAQAMWGIKPTLEPLAGQADQTAVSAMAQDQASNTIWALAETLSDQAGISGWQRYVLRAMHLAAHQTRSRKLIADNWSPIQRLTVEWFEDCRVDYLTQCAWPGLKRLMQQCHPDARSDQCDSNVFSGVRHRLAVFSAAVIWQDPNRLPDTTQKALYEAFMRACHEQADTAQIAQLALTFATQTRHVKDQTATVFFENTVVDWRDDNRHLWLFIEDGDEEDTAPTPTQTEPTDDHTLPPQHYPEWDALLELERPDWVSVYARLHPSGQAHVIDQLLTVHAPLMKQLKQVMDAFKPQSRRRQRFIEQGTELDWDVALQAYTDFKLGHTPSPKIEQYHVPAQRDIAVHVLMDLSASLNDRREDNQTILQISQAAVALLAWVMSQLGDTFAISGFHSNTRHHVRFLHIKGYQEPWDDTVKARLAAIEPNYSTRLGAALRHAAASLRHRSEAKKLLLVLTDGQPSDVDVNVPDYLVADAHRAVTTLQEQGVFTWCMHLETASQDAVTQVFGHHVTVLSDVGRLPQALTQLFLKLTKS